MIANDVAFETSRNPRRGVPRVLKWFMLMVFAMPAIALPLFTLQDLQNAPWLALLYLVAWFPVAVVFVLDKLFQRFELRVFRDGAVEIVYPLGKPKRIEKMDLSSMKRQRIFVQATNSYQEWIRLINREGKIIASISPLAFSQEELSQFFASVREVNNVEIETT